MSDWQPIETAPKDGTEVLVCTEMNLVRVAFFDRARGGIWSSWPGRNMYVPSHWMKLPTTPRGLATASSEEREEIEVQRLASLTDDERLGIFMRHCRDCGSKNPSCQCMNDE